MDTHSWQQDDDDGDGDDSENDDDVVVIAVCGPVDLAFLIDSSGSIGKVNWPKILNFMKTFSSKLTVSPDGARIAAISFGNDAMLHFGLDSHATLKSTQDAIDAMRWKDQWTNTGAALRVMKNKVFKVCNTHIDWT